MQKNKNADLTSPENDFFNLRETIKKYGYHWKLFFMSVIAALLLAFIYLQFAPYRYEATSTILINDEDNGGESTSNSAVIEDLGLFGGQKISLDTEIGILKSKTLIERVVKELKLNVAYYIKSGIGTKEVYKDRVPFNINLFLSDSRLNQLDTIFSISAKSTTQYILSDANGNPVVEGLFGENISCEFGDMVVTPSNINDVALESQMTVKINTIEDTAISIKKRIEIVPEKRNSNLLTLTLQDPIQLKAVDILDNLVLYYNKDAVEQKSQLAKTTEEFIDNRIDAISIELTGLDQGVEKYKTRNRLSNLDSEANLTLASNAAAANQIVELTSQIKLIDYITEYMKTNKDDLIPSNLGLMNENTIQSTINYNNLLLERNRLLSSANEENPVVTNLNSQIERLRTGIDRSLFNIRSSLEFSLQEIKQEEIRLDSKMSTNPRKEREIRDIQRQQETIETLYLYLLQKKEENSISLAITAPNATIVDKAYSNKIPVAPRKLMILMGSLLAGLLIPASLITVRSLLDNKVHTAEDLEGILKAPLLGSIPTARSGTETVVFEDKNSVVAESFRLLRTNVDHMLQNGDRGAKINKKKDFESTNEKVESKKRPKTKSAIGKIGFEPSFDIDEKSSGANYVSSNHAKMIFVTSTIRNEGKTFIAVNLAKALALLNKRVLFIEADIRNPRVAEYLKTKRQKGLTHFLAEPGSKITDVIRPYKESNLDLLAAGDIASSPSELLANGRFDEAVLYGKQHYDYVVVDTPPANVATDTLLLGHHAHLFIYVIRANFLDKKLLHIPKKMYKNRRLPSMAILMNDANYEKRGYNSEYGFGQMETKKGWLKRLLN